MDFELVNKMKVGELKTYLRLRGLKVFGREVELVARVFAASENNVQPVKTAGRWKPKLLMNIKLNFH